MGKTIDWIKNNKLATFLLVVVAFFLLKGSFNLFVPSLLGSPSRSGPGGSYMDFESSPVAEFSAGDSYGGLGTSTYKAMPPVSNQAAPQPDIDERMVKTETMISIFVRNVTDTVNSIVTDAKDIKGYVVTRNIVRDETTVNGTLRVRIPNTELEEFLEKVKGYALKVKSENVSGQDITDSYIDTQRRLEQYESMITRLESLLEQSTDIDQMIRIQNQIFSQQREVENIKGRLNYMEGVTSTSMVTIYLSTDEYSLPFVEPLSWRPEVIFKQATRSMIGTVQAIGTLGIWLAVYSVVILPAVGVFILIRSYIRKRKTQQQTQ